MAQSETPNMKREGKCYWKDSKTLETKMFKIDCHGYFRKMFSKMCSLVYLMLYWKRKMVTAAGYLFRKRFQPQPLLCKMNPDVFCFCQCTRVGMFITANPHQWLFSCFGNRQQLVFVILFIDFLRDWYPTHLDMWLLLPSMHCKSMKAKAKIA